MTSSYTVPEDSNDMQFSGHNTRHDEQESELQSIADLPKFLRWGIYLAPTRWKKTYMTVATLMVIGIVIPIYSYILSSPAIGIVIGAIHIPILANKVRQPDFTKGIFLDILLKDAKVTKKINSNIVNAMISTAIIQGLVLIPIFWIFFIYPFATMEPGMLGKYTYEITMVFGILGTLCSFCFLLVFMPVNTLPDQIRLVHEEKIKRYLSTVRDLILNDNAEEDGIPLVDKLYMEQEKVEKWIVEINNGISAFLSFRIVGFSVYLILSLGIVGGGYSIGASIGFSIFALSVFALISSSLYAIAKPNMVSMISMRADGPSIILT